MLVDLLEVLRCPALHEDAALVVVATRTVNRDILEGTLGCLVCGAEYPVREGAAWFGCGTIAPPPAELAPSSRDAAETIRLAALLGIDERGGRFLFDGAWSTMVGPLTRMFPIQTLLLEGKLPGVSALRECGDGLPLAAGCLRGAVLARPSASLAAAAARSLQSAGRLIAPAETRVPTGVSLLARDARQWVAARDHTAIASAPVRLRRGS